MIARKVAIIGTGLMGGSLGLALQRSQTAEEVIGFDKDDETLRQALGRAAITEAAVSAEEAASGAAFVFVATPVSSIPAAVAAVADRIAPGGVITDVGSTKSSVVAAATPLVGEGRHFIGGHPIAGSEQEGIDAADPAIFEGAYWILTPTSSTDAGAYGSLVRLLGKLGVKVISLDPARHDEAMALSSHLPQVLSSAFMEFAAGVAASEQGAPLLAAGGFRDLTRIAASPPELWVGILKENRPALLELMDRFLASLDTTRDALRRQDWSQVLEGLERARAARVALGKKHGVAAEDLMEIRVAVPDRPGVLAEVTTTVGEAGVNIEDLDIIHSSEGGRGTIHLTVRETSATRAIEALAQHGFRTEPER